MIPLPPPRSRKQKAITNVIFGGLAGATAKTVIAPMDRVKIMFQVTPSKPFNLREAWHLGVDIYRTTGIPGLWRGNMSTMLRIMPYAAIQFACFEHYEHLLRDIIFPGLHLELSPPIYRLLAGAAAGATSVAFTYPLDLMRARYAADPKINHLPVMQAYRTLIGEHGFQIMYRGFAPTMLGILPYAGISFATFGTLKAQFLSLGAETPWTRPGPGAAHHIELHGPNTPIPPEYTELKTGTRFICGAFAGGLAQTCTYPLDLVRRRQQVGAYMVGSEDTYRGLWRTLSHIFRHERTHGLWRGVTMNWIKGPLSVGVSFTVFDLLQSSYKRYRHWKHVQEGGEEEEEYI